MSCRLPILVFAACLAACLPRVASSSTAAVAPGQPPADAAQAPVLVVDTLDHGRFELAEQRGKWVVVNYWATWCSPCLKEIPDLSALHDARDDVTVVGLAYEEIDAEQMRAFLREHPASYPIALLDVYAPPAAFSTPRGLPMTYLVAPDGHVARSFLGPVTSQELVRVIDAPGADPASSGGAQ